VPHSKSQHSLAKLLECYDMFLECYYMFTEYYRLPTAQVLFFLHSREEVHIFLGVPTGKKGAFGTLHNTYVFAML
jgi:hypothetical protein